MAGRSSEKALSVATAAKSAFEASQAVDGTERVRALSIIRAQLDTQKTAILEANRQDIEV